MRYERDDVLAGMRLVSKAIATNGAQFNRHLREDAKGVLVESGGNSGDPLPLAICVAVAMSWLTPDASQRTHALKVHDLIRACVSTDDAHADHMIDNYSHPKKFAVQFGVRFWLPIIRANSLDWVPSAREYKEIHDDQIVSRGSTQNCRWSVLAPIKVAAISNKWKRKAIDRITPPLGATVRNGIKTLLGYDVPTPENAAGHQVAFQIQRHLAELSGASVQDINSGLWKLGE